MSTVTMRTKTVKAKKVREGDFIPGLDNAYVFEDPERTEYDITILFNDAEGGEGQLVCAHDMPITIQRVPK